MTTTQAPLYADISSFQPANINWQAYRSWAAQWDGISRMALKSTEGVGFIDPHFVEYRKAALAAGIDQIIYYAYGRPDLNPGTAGAINEANYQRMVVGGALRSHDLLMLDYEVQSAAANAAWAYAWLSTQEKTYNGRRPIIYASDAYVRARLQGEPRLARYGLVLANWTYNPVSRPPCPPPWSRYVALQYSDRANIPGIGAGVDCNVYLQGGSFMLTLTDASAFFDATNDPQVWHCKQTGVTLGHGMLSHYQAAGDAPLYGLTLYGLPKTPEISVPGHAGSVLQVFERAVLVYDPAHTIDSPPGAGAVYSMRLDDVKSPAVVELLTLLGLPSGGTPAQLVDALVQAKTIVSAASAIMKDLGAV